MIGMFFSSCKIKKKKNQADSVDQSEVELNVTLPFFCVFNQELQQLMILCLYHDFPRGAVIVKGYCLAFDLWSHGSNEQCSQ